MAKRHQQPANPDESRVYQIRIRGQLGPQWAEWFEGLTIAQVDGDTILTGVVFDQSALHGLLKKVRDLGVPLISVTRIEADQPE